MKSLCALAVLTVAVIIYAVPHLFGCGPFLPVAIFTTTSHPDLPLDDFARGDIGVLQPSYARSYLVIGYRYLSGNGLDPDGQKAILTLWKKRLDLEPTRAVEPWQVWLYARSKVPELPPSPEIGVYRLMAGSYEEYLNCPEDAFSSAATTLNERIAKFGATSAEVKEWMTGQDQVFANCAANASVPGGVPEGTNPLIKADRRYQIASANFYQTNWDTAERMFSEIARDEKSPWNQIAAYLAARALTRKGTLVPGEDQLDLSALSNAEADLKEILADGSLRKIHPAAAKLLHFVQFRLHPEDRLRDLTQSVLQKNSGSTFMQDLDDYTLLLDRSGHNPHDSDITDWLLTFQDSSPAALDHSLQKYRETHSDPWLVACLSKLAPTRAETPQFLQAAQDVKPQSAAFASVSFYAANLLAQSGKADASRRLVDAAVAQPQGLPPSSRNLFLALQAGLANNLNGFLRHIPRIPAAITLDAYGRQIPENMGNDQQVKKPPLILLDSDSAYVLNERMPISVLQQAAGSSVLPANLRREIAIATWVRCILLEEYDSGGQVASTLELLAPELKPGLEEFRAAQNDQEKRFAAILLILRMPGLRPYVSAGLGRITPIDKVDSFHDNWWCPLGGSENLKSPNLFLANDTLPLSLRAIYPDGKVPFPEFLTEPQRSIARDEWLKLSSIGTAPNFLAEQVITWSKQRPSDTRVAEALYLTVEGTRWGCVNRETSGLSKQAFQILHHQYPSSSWAGKAEHWY